MTVSQNLMNEPLGLTWTLPDTIQSELMLRFTPWPITLSVKLCSLPSDKFGRNGVMSIYGK
jgi:hypothetical protein